MRYPDEASFLRMKSQLLNIILVILTLTACVLGYFVYEKYAPPSREIPAVQNDEEPGVETVSGDIPNYADMTDTELVHALPNQSEVSQDVLQAFSVEADTRAVAADTITIDANCAATPGIANVALGDTITFKNNDGRTHTLNVTPEDAVRIDANASAQLTVEFETGVGMYGYSCDNQSALSGILIVR